jgi:hypothetical protein
MLPIVVTSAQRCPGKGAARWIWRCHIDARRSCSGGDGGFAPESAGSGSRRLDAPGPIDASGPRGGCRSRHAV